MQIFMINKENTSIVNTIIIKNSLLFIMSGDCFFVFHCETFHPVKRIYSRETSKERSA
jgi:hypothetical protein